MFAGRSVDSDLLFAPVDIGRLKSPAMTTFGVFVCVLYSFVRKS